MFRHITFWVLLVAFAAQTFQQAGTVLGYYINPVTYVKNCENKARPQLKCGGKCQLMKKLREEEKKDQQVPERKLENKNEVLFSSAGFYTASLLLRIGQIVQYQLYIPAGTADRSFPVFHPPASV